MNGAKKQSKFRWMVGIWRHVRARLFAVVALTIVYTACMIATPYFFKLVVDGISTGLTSERVTFYVILLFVTGVGSGVLYFALQANRVRVNMRVEWLVRGRVYRHLCRLGPSFYNRFTSGDVVTRLTDDLPEKIAWFSCSGVFRLFEGLMLFVFTLCAMFMLNWKLTLLALVPMPLLGLLFHSVGRYFHKRYERLQELITKANDVLEAAVSGIRVVKAYCREEYHRRLFDKALEERINTEVSLVKVQSFFYIMSTVLGEVGMIVVVWAGGRMVIGGTLALGNLVAFNSYLLMLIGPMWTLGMFFQLLKRAEVSIGRIMEMETAVPDVPELAVACSSPADATKDAVSAVEFENVSYSYPVRAIPEAKAEGADRKKKKQREEARLPEVAAERKEVPIAAVTDVNVSVQPGTRLGIAGKVGSGKSTLLWLVPRVFDPRTGRVTRKGEDLRSLELQVYRRGIGLVPQDSFLFSDSIRANIIFGREWITEDDLWKAVRAAQLETDLKEMPGGIDEKVGPRGVTLSGGQKQRVCIARALAGRPAILVLDDATSNLDSETELQFWESLKHDWPGVTAFIVSHRLSTMARTDQVIAVDKGRVIECGPHAELASRNSAYLRILQRMETASSP